MKRIFMILLSAVAISLNTYAGGDYEPDCDLVLTSYTNSSSPIEVWEDNYQQCLYYEWDVTFSSEWDCVDIDYTIDLNPEGAFDNLRIYIQDENGQEREVLHYLYQPIAGRLTLPLYTHTARVVFQSYYGNTGGLYKGFKLYYREGHANTSNHVFLTNVGIGTYPQETLHVNGAIRGGGANGEVTLKGDNGSLTIGATDAQTMTFNTDKSKYVFNKPIYNKSGIYDSWTNTNLQFNTNGTNRMVILSNGNVGIGLTNPREKLHISGPIRGDGTNGALRIRTDMGTTEIGPIDPGYSRFNTTLSAFYFNKKIIIESGTISSSINAPLYFKIGDTSIPMYIRTNGNVGIGTLTPQYKLDVEGSLHAQTLNVDSVLCAEEIIVRTNGADFVFADDYQLRPLSEVEAFITENKHLPEIQSAQEMQENGVSVSELQTRLLQKIEELTLYLIQQEQTIQELRQEVEQLKK